MPRGKLRQRSQRQDVYYRRAKQEQFAARSVYKLQEIDERWHLLRTGMRVLDLGCWPGSWLQYAAKRVGTTGKLVGLDRFEVEVVIEEPPLRALVGDVFTVTPETLRGELSGFDVVLSDMAPDTSGIRMQDQARSEALFERALWLAEHVLVPGGHFVGKLFQGPAWNELLRRMRERFVTVHTMRPESTRTRSREQYLVGLRRR